MTSRSRQVIPRWRLELIGISKSYANVVANQDISLRVKPGEIHGLVGENGAGKSTLMKILYGMVRPDAGQIIWNDKETLIESPAAAQRLGIGMILQHFALFDTLTAAENIALGLLGRPPLADVIRQVEEVGQQYSLPIDPMQHVYTMSVGQRQRVEILRALLQSPKLLIMDEPTSVLTPQAVERLFDTLRVIAAEGCSIIYISHKLGEVQSLCHRATVLRRGRVVQTCQTAQESEASLAHMMIGSSPPKLREKDAASFSSRTRLEVRDISVHLDDPFSTPLNNISLAVREGEILGIAGVAGNGQQELFSVLSGEIAKMTSGSLWLDGEELTALSPLHRRRLGLCALPDDRMGRGAVGTMPLTWNLLLTNNGAKHVRHGFIRFRHLNASTEDCISQFNVVAPGVNAKAASLSGGNLQKFLIGREVLQQPKVLIVSQPTWGVDVGAAAAIHQVLLDLSAEGCAIIVISEELDELFQLSDRLVVMASGTLTDAVERADFDCDAVGLAMAGQSVPAREQEATDAVSL
jgi:simple sugar transport system ATP-binding protein